MAFCQEITNSGTGGSLLGMKRADEYSNSVSANNFYGAGHGAGQSSPIAPATMCLPIAVSAQWEVHEELTRDNLGKVSLWGIVMLTS